jgi:sedoheptulose-bisphosphatase
METVAAASYAGRTGATRSPAYCAAMSFSQSYRPKVREALL